MSDFIGSIGHALWEAVLPSMATVLAGMVMLVVKRFLAKQGLELTTQQEVRLKQIVKEKVNAVEERAHRGEIDKEDKHEAAVTAVVRAATEDNSIPNPTREEASEVIDATLGATRSVHLPNPGLPGLGRR
jgi:glutamyl/glutaminyl-tRNA synthetase